METISWTERCDCYEKYGRACTWNGGNYHRIVRPQNLECGLPSRIRTPASDQRRSPEYIVRDAEFITSGS